jgi:hypothetical protein
MQHSDSQQRFDSLLRRRLLESHLRLAAHGLLAVLMVTGVATGTAAWVLGRAVSPAATVKLVLFGACLMVIFAATWGFWFVPWRRRASRSKLCRDLERSGSFANLLVAAEEASRRPERWDKARHVSPELVRRLLSGATAVVSEFRLGRLLPLPGAGRVLLGTAAVALLWSAVLTHEPIHSGYARLLHFWRDDSSPPRIGLYLEHGPTQVIAGQNVLLSARDFGTPQQAAICEVRSGSGLWRPLECRPDSLAAGGSYVRWLAPWPAVRESFSYRFRRDAMVTDAREVSVLQPPMLASLAGLLDPPAYTGLPPQRLDPLPTHLDALAGSRLVWAGKANHDLSWAAAVTASGDTLVFSALGDSLSGAVTIESPFRYALHLRDERNLPNASRLLYEVSVLEDSPPAVRLSRPQDDGLIPVSGRILLEGDAGDDFGLVQVDLLIRREEPTASPVAADLDAASWRRLTIWRAEDRTGRPASEPVEIPWRTDWGSLSLRVAGSDSNAARPLTWRRVLETDLQGLELIPGDVMAVCLEALDNREPGPPGRGRSRVLRLAFPSAADILTAQAGQETNRLESLEQIERRSQALAEELARLDREIKKNPLPDWNRQQELEGLLAQQQGLQDQLDGVAEQLQSDLSSLMENELTSGELVSKMEQISELLSQIHNEDLDELLRTLREAVAKLSPDEVQHAVAEIRRHQEDVLRRLDQTLAALKEISREQELEGLTSLLAKLLREQQQLLESVRQESDRPSAERAPAAADSAASGPTEPEPTQQEPPADRDAASEQPADSEEMAQRQEALAEEMARLEERLREALRQLEQERAAGDSSLSASMLQEALEQAQQEMNSRQPQESMDEAARRLQQQQQNEAESNQEQAVRDLAALYHVLLKSRQGMQMALMRNQAISLRRLAGDLLTLSERQEEIAGSVPADLHDVPKRDLTRRQFRVLKATRRLHEQLREISASSPGQTVRLLRKLDELIDQLDRSVRGMEAGQGPLARRASRGSLGQMNEIVIALLTEAQKSCSGCGQGQCSLPSMGQQLQNMAREQAGLNALTDRVRQQMQQSGLSQEIRAQMERLKTDQGSLAGQSRDVAEMQKQLREGDRVLGDLEQLAAEMEKVVRDLDQDLVSEETLLRQERILSRLLDAHNSVRKRDFSQRRESRTAERLFARQPSGDTPSPGSEPDSPLPLRYQPVEQAPPEYRELVRHYFQAVEEILQTPARPNERRPRDGSGP